MMRPCITEPMNEEGVTRLMEYIIITGVLLLLMTVMMFSVNTSLMEGPAERLRYHAFVDIGNGISTRIVDLYIVSPTTEPSPQGSIFPKKSPGGATAWTCG